jgi:hypothetical protein
MGNSTDKAEINVQMSWYPEQRADNNILSKTQYLSLLSLAKILMIFFLHSPRKASNGIKAERHGCR